MKKSITVIIVFLTVQLNFAQKNIEITYERKEDKSIEFYYKKKVPGSYYLIIEFTKLENCNQSTVFKKVINQYSGALFRLRPANPKKGISFAYKSKYSFGNPSPKINEEISYLLPFKEGKSVKIIEASNLGEKYFGSKKPIDWKSFIVYLNTPDTVYAMRKGTVVKIVDEFNGFKESSNKAFTTKRNRILVEHKDGTYASYKGFNKNQIFVKLGQEIYPHTPLGKIEEFSKGKFRFDFNVFYYLKNLSEDKKSTLVKRNQRIKYLNPNFLVDQEVTKITSKETYEVSFNETIKLQEFSRKEKKKYKKGPSEFK